MEQAENQSTGFQMTINSMATTQNIGIKLAEQDSSASHCKGRLADLENQIKELDLKRSMHRKEVQLLRGEKETLEGTLKLKIHEMNTIMQNEILKLEQLNLKQQTKQKQENAALKELIHQYKCEKMLLEQQMIALQARMQDLEAQLGRDD